MKYFSATKRAAVSFAASLLVPMSPASAELVLSQLGVELQPGKTSRQDIEILNGGPEVAYVAVEPREILTPGAAVESARVDPDPEGLGLLVSPARMILEAGRRKLVRVAALATQDRERVYRITVKPVAGKLPAAEAALKILIGYDVLVLVRPTDPRPQVTGVRSKNALTLRNIGNASVELVQGKKCDASGKTCDPLPGGRLYAGGEKAIAIDSSQRASYMLKIGSKLIPKSF